MDETPVNDTETPSLCNITSTDLVPLVEIRRRNQTEQAKKGVRTYKPTTVRKPRKDNPGESSEELSDREKLAQKINAIRRQAQERAFSTGRNRTGRWQDTGNEKAAGIQNGNSANAEVVAKGRASDVSSLDLETV